VATVRISYQLVREAMQSKPVRAALRAKAEKKARRADSLGSAEGVKIDAKVSEGTRPKGRPYARVTSANVGQEWGDRETERRRILGRVAEEG
jgi:hypothetical protein